MQRKFNSLWCKYAPTGLLIGALTVALAGLARDSYAGQSPNGPTCDNDGDCDDGLYCNGEETCFDGVCQGGTSPCSEACEEETQNCFEPEANVTKCSLLDDNTRAVPDSDTFEFQGTVGETVNVSLDGDWPDAVRLSIQRVSNPGEKIQNETVKGYLPLELSYILPRDAEYRIVIMSMVMNPGRGQPLDAHYCLNVQADFGAQSTLQAMSNVESVGDPAE